MPASQTLLRAAHAHADEAHLQRAVTCADECMCWNDLPVALSRTQMLSIRVRCDVSRLHAGAPRIGGGRWCVFDGDFTNSDHPEEREFSTSDAAVSHCGRVGSTSTHAINAARSGRKSSSTCWWT